MAIREIYPEHIDRKSYNKALGQYVIAGNWLFNQSDMDLWFDIDGFEIKVPAGTRILCTGWDQVRRCVEDMNEEEFYGCRAPVGRCGFKFVSGHTLYIYNDLVVFSPDSARTNLGSYGTPERSLEEHIALINTMKLERATIIAENLNFLPRCPTLKHLSIKHASSLEAGLNFSPIYELPNLETLNIAAPSLGLHKSPAIRLDFTRLQNLRHISLCTNDVLNYSQLPKLETIWLSNNRRHEDLTNLSCSPYLKRIDLLQCSTKSLTGIGHYPLQQINISYLRTMEDISELRRCSDTLRALSIEACGKIQDFSCLYDLNNLEHLCLLGSNHLPNLDFLRNMPKLKTFVFSMDIKDGDLSPCLNIPYVSCSKMKRHYNLREKDLPKAKPRIPFTLL